MEVEQNVESIRPDLHWDHEETDTMLVVYVSLVNSDGIMVKSLSGYMYIVTLFLYHAMSFDADIFIDNGTGSQSNQLLWSFWWTTIQFLSEGKRDMLEKNV